MTETIKSVFALVLAICVHFQPLFAGADITAVLGIPTAESYTDQHGLSRSVWDMEVQDGILYIGAGDYSANTGPTSIWAYDIAAQTWSDAATVKDESVCRFCKTEDALLVPGIDSTAASWKYGNYHTLTDGRWESFEKLPGAVHNFDVVRFDGNYFFALGTASGKTSPVLISPNGTEDFTPVPFYKNGKSMLTTKLEYSRVYDFFALDGELYCLLATYKAKSINRMFCHYEDGVFVCLAEADLNLTPWKQIPVMGKASVGTVQYFTTGTLYKTEDFLRISPIEIPDNGVVTDLYTYQDGQQQRLYVLSNVHNEDGTYTATIYLMDDRFTAVAAYTAQVPALSLVRDGLYFYIGLGGSAESADTGKVVRLSVFDRILSAYK